MTLSDSKMESDQANDLHHSSRKSKVGRRESLLLKLLLPNLPNRHFKYSPIELYSQIKPFQYS